MKIGFEHLCPLHDVLDDEEMVDDQCIYCIEECESSTWD